MILSHEQVGPKRSAKYQQKSKMSSGFKTY